LCENHNGQDSAYLHELTRITKLLRDNIRVADTAGGRIVELVKSLRSFARLDQSEFQKVDIHNGLESSITILGTETLQNIRINRKYDPKLPAIFCWPGQLNQVFFNVLKNAAEAISGSGEINITTGSHENGIQVEISDSGQGIPPERLNTLFDFGFSTGQSRVRLSSGLAIAYSIIERHKGNIRLESKPAVGTTVTIELPLSPAQDGVRK
ncbi:MAG: hypothetical protein KDI06_15220, partial [Calditrichaeota bacterium]|nr:hypothetical protein [Calditrichota bacterium]